MVASVSSQPYVHYSPKTGLMTAIMSRLRLKNFQIFGRRQHRQFLSLYHGLGPAFTFNSDQFLARLRTALRQGILNDDSLTFAEKIIRIRADGAEKIHRP